jgi:hypothetical protein
VGWRGGVVVEGPVVASRWKGVAGELVETIGGAPGNKSGGGVAVRGGVLTGGRVGGDSG